MLSVYGQSITTLQINEGKKVFEENKNNLIPVYPNCITRVYGYGRGMEYSQTRYTCPKILFIVCRF